MIRREISPLLLSVPEAALAIRVSENELRIWVREGIVPSVRWRPNSHPLIPVEALHEFVRQAQVSKSASAPSSSRRAS